MPLYYLPHVHALKHARTHTHTHIHTRECTHTNTHTHTHTDHHPYSVTIFTIAFVILAPLFLLLPLALQPVVGFGLSNNVPPFCPVCHQLSPSSHSQHLKTGSVAVFPIISSPYEPCLSSSSQKFAVITTCRSFSNSNHHIQ
jgi:hypothetical protein